MEDVGNYIMMWHENAIPESDVGNSIFVSQIKGNFEKGAKKNKRVFLHQKEIEFIHPVTKEKMKFVSKKQLIL